MLKIDIINRLFYVAAFTNFIVSVTGGIHLIHILDRGLGAVGIGMFVAVILVGYLCFDIIFSYVFDGFSRRLSVLLGQLVTGGFSISMLYLYSETMLLLSGLLFGISNALFSGSLIAIFLENFKDKKNIKHNISKINIVTTISTTLAMILGIIITLLINTNTVFVVCAIMNFSSAPFIFLLLPKNKNVFKITFKKIALDINKIKYIYLDNKMYYKTSLRTMILLIIGITSTFWAYFVFDDKANDNFNNILIIGSGVIIYQFIYFIGSVIVNKCSTKVSLSIAIALIFLSVLFIICFLFITNHTIIFLISATFIAIGLDIVDLLFTIIYQKAIPDEIRSTASSFYTSGVSAIQAIIFPYIGIIIHNYPNDYLLSIYLFALILIVVTSVTIKKQTI